MFSNLKSYLIDAAILDFVKVLLEEIIQVSKEPFKPIWCEVFSENQRRSSYPLSTEKKKSKIIDFLFTFSKREIPQSNYVMHTAHCARNITLCNVCKEPIARAKYEEHSKKCVPQRPSKQKTPEPPKTNLEKSPYFQSRKEVQDKKLADRKEKYLERHEKFLGNSMVNFQSQNKASTNKTVTNSQSANVYQSVSSSASSNGAVKKEEKKSNGAIPKASNGLMPCRYCDLELPKMELEEHENYCGSRTDKCLECGELVMFKYKQMHLDTNHGFLKLKEGELF